MAQGRIVYDGAKARRCLDQANAITTCGRTVVAALGSLTDCSQILAGQVPTGGNCFFGEECQDHASCLPADSSCDSFTQCCGGTCGTGTTEVPVGGDCTPPSAICASGATCVTSTDGQSATCQPFQSLGASCASIRCAGALYCEPATQTCLAPSPETGACHPALNGVDCDDPRDWCDATGHCAPRLAVGAACSPSETGCVRWATCDATTSTCAALPGVGESCQGPCLGGAACQGPTNVCTLTAVGASCL